MNTYANHFAQIPTALDQNPSLQRRMVALIAAEPVVGKSTSEPERLAGLREILRRLTLGQSNIHQAIREVEARLPPEASRFGQDRRVFPRGWAERLVRTQFSRFYNQAMLEELKDAGIDECFVPLSPSQDGDTQCSQHIAGRVHSVDELHGNLVNAYGKGDFSPNKRIPEHPHCTHVVRPILED